jgi:tRNA nucleotidyltransferase (CCA-adding enzyme)
MPTIRQVMRDCAVTVLPEQTLTDAVRVLCEHHLSGAPVVSSEGDILGYISESMLMDVLFDEDARSALVEDYMVTGVHVVHPDDSIASAASTFALYEVRRLPVVENGQLVGVLTRRDLLQYTLSGAEPFRDPIMELIPALGEYA